MEPFTTFIWKRIFVQLGGVIAIAAILGGFVFVYNATYNNVAGLDQLADARWAQVARDMQERYGGIPALEAGIRPSLGADVSALDEVSKNLTLWQVALRNGDIRKINPATTNLEASIGYFSDILKAHPQAATSWEVQDFMGTLGRTGAQLSDDRSGYNEAIQRYNQAISSFPASLWTYNWGFLPREYFTARIGPTAPPPIPGG